MPVSAQDTPAPHSRFEQPDRIIYIDRLGTKEQFIMERRFPEPARKTMFAEFRSADQEAARIARIAKHRPEMPLWKPEQWAYDCCRTPLLDKYHLTDKERLALYQEGVEKKW